MPLIQWIQQNLPQRLFPNGIPSAEAFGVPKIVEVVTASGIASSEAFGSDKLTLVVLPSGVASSQGFGTPAIVARISPSGIASSEAFSAPTIAVAQPFKIDTGRLLAEAEDERVLLMAVLGLVTSDHYLA